jgi:Tol biopolymer transport system component
MICDWCLPNIKKKEMLRLIPGLLTFILLFSCSPNNESLTVDYLGQKSPIGKAELFAFGTISTDAFEHSAPSFAPDGKTVLWAIMEMPSYKASILEMNFEKGRWSAPHRPSFSDPTVSDIYPSFSPDGKLLYFSSERKLPSGKSPEKGNIIWRVEKTENGWATPEPLDSAVSNGGEYAPSVTTNGNLYFTYGPYRTPDWNILVSERTNHSNTKPQPLAVVNSSGYEDGPCIAPDESFLIFESDRPGGVEGSIDLYISFRSENGNWGVPINMGSKINSSASERFARLSPDGNYLFFGSNRRQIQGNPNFDIYWIETSVIHELKQNKK